MSPKNMPAGITFAGRWGALRCGRRLSLPSLLGCLLPFRQPIANPLQCYRRPSSAVRANARHSGRAGETAASYSVAALPARPCYAPRCGARHPFPSLRGSSSLRSHSPRHAYQLTRAVRGDFRRSSVAGVSACRGGKLCSAIASVLRAATYALLEKAHTEKQWKR